MGGFFGGLDGSYRHKPTKVYLSLLLPPRTASTSQRTSWGETQDWKSSL
jgi:hypothetical protein